MCVCVRACVCVHVCVCVCEVGEGVGGGCKFVCSNSQASVCRGSTVFEDTI